MKHLKQLKTLMTVMILSLLTTVAISCGDEEEDPIIYTVTVMTAEGGSADASRYEVIAGEEVTLTAEPEEGYKFKCWMQNGAEVSTANPYTFIVNRNIVYIAKFIKEGEEEEGEEGDNSDQPSEIKTFDILAEIEKDEMVFVQGGSYNMGATEEQGSDAKANEKPSHIVILSDYYISRYEVTQKFWETIMGNNPSSVKGDDLPVDNVSWEECNQFIQELNKRTGKQYSLPTEAEWEYAARGGDKRNGTKYSGSNNAEEVAWSDALDGTIQSVGTKKYNELGIYDMSGNVSEWCYDWYGAYTDQDQANPIGAETGTEKVLRGGNCSDATINCRVTIRTSTTLETAKAKTGFRIVLSKPTYKVTAKPSTEEGGSITINSNYVREGGKATLTAIPKENNHFVNWTLNGAEVSKEKTFTPTITQNVEYIANFGNYKITVTASEGGTAKSNKTHVEHNGQVTLTATPQEGYSFVNWTVEGKEVSTQNPYTATITEDIEIKANFNYANGATGLNNSKGYVDLGLSVKWATYNVGANSPEEYGDYFAWGETEPKTTYNWGTYKYCNGTYDSMTKYCTYSEGGIVDNKTTLELSDDAARVNWGGSWRMPPKAEQHEVINTNNCTWTWTTQNGVNGYKVTSKKNGNSIFLPAAGYRYSSNLYGAGSTGSYWSSSLSTDSSGSAYYLGFSSSGVGWNAENRYNGYSVRPVCE